MSVRGNYCDLATKLDGVVATLIEVKAVGIELKDQHVRQAVDYAANQGVEWVLLTNGIMWRVYRVQFSKPIEHELVVEVNFCAISPKSARDLECLYLWCKEGWIRSVLGDFAAQKEALSPYFLGALMLSDSVLDVMRRELRRISPDVHIDTDEIKTVLLNEVIKREILEGDRADIARRKIARCANNSLRILRPKECVPSQRRRRRSQTERRNSRT